MIGYLNFQSLRMRKCKRNPPDVLGASLWQIQLKGIPGVSQIKASKPTSAYMK